MFILQWEDPDAPWPPEASGKGTDDPYWDVVPIPFYPDDLPRLTLDPFGWAPAELKSAVVHARKLLFPLHKGRQ